MVISSSMGTKLKLHEPAVLCVLAVSFSDGLETGAPVVFQWVKYTDVFGQDHKKILKQVWSLVSWSKGFSAVRIWTSGEKKGQVPDDRIHPLVVMPSQANHP
eukprot:COSAG05_NODE_587_length_8516_cov_10.000356_2_plen_102_part_00